MFGDILQPTHLLFILVVALLVLGPKRLPEAGRALGRGLRDFKTAISGEDDHHTEISTATPSATTATATPPVTYAEPAAPTFAEPTATFAEPAAATPPPADHAIQAAVFAATPAEDATAEAVEQPAESAQSVG